MKKWQKYWLYFLIAYSLLHLTRDILQDFGVSTFLSTVLVKETYTPTPITNSVLYASSNTYLIAITEILISIICLKRKYFGKIGFLSIFIAGASVLAWSIYWFFF